jgi:hypothetical protein
MKILVITPTYNEARNPTTLISASRRSCLSPDSGVFAPGTVSNAGVRGASYGRADNKKRPNSRGPIMFEFPHPMEHGGNHG